jgi:ribonucleoside-diphosphate reductase alpha chain
MFHRVAKHVATSPEEEESFFDLLKENLFLPNSPCLTNAGMPGRMNQLSACFVLDVADSIEAIYDTIKETALIHKSGGGTGFNFSNLRPSHSVVASTGGIASGPVSFMKVFDASTEGIKQGGTRRGANMGVLRIDHPDIMEFIKCKSDGVTMQNFNISVGITNNFMQALIERRTYDLIDPHTGLTVATHPAKKVFDSLVDNAWLTGDPGVLFIDRINEHNPLVGEHNKIAATNPCGEQPLAPDESCGLGSINLSSMVQPNGVFDYDKLRQVTMRSILFLHRMIHVSEYPNSRIATRVKASSKIGLGHMGFADALIKMKIPYTSEEAIDFASKVAECIIDASVCQTHAIGQKEGTFELFDEYKTPKHIKHALQREGIPVDMYRPADSCLTTIAPTGTISIVADTSSGIEPIFYLEQIEDRADAVIYHRHPLYAAWLEKNPNTPKPSYFQDLNDIDYETHIAIQSTFQRYICSGVSKTVNLPNDADHEVIAQIIHEAYYTGCKGTTIYRDGSKNNQVISDATKVQAGQNRDKIRPAERPEVLHGKTYQIRTGYGDMLVTINSLSNDEPFEVICQLGKSGASETAKAEAIGKLVSTLLRCSVDPEIVIKQLEGIVGGSTIIGRHGTISSIPDALAKIMRIHTENLGVKQVPAMMRCPERECGSINLQAEGSCIKCLDCGWKSCS